MASRRVNTVRETVANKGRDFNILVRALSNHLRLPCQEGTYEWGRLFEAFIISQIRTALEYQRARPTLSYLRTKGGAEIDLIVERPGKPTLCLEINSGSIIHPGELSNLADLSAQIPKGKPLCLYAGELPLVKDGVQVLPFNMGLAEIQAF